MIAGAASLAARSALLLAAQRLRDLFAVIKWMFRVTRKPVGDRVPAAFRVLAIAREILIFKVLQHGE